MPGVDASPLVTILGLAAGIAAVLALLGDRIRIPVDPATGWSGSPMQALRSPTMLAASPLVLVAGGFAISGVVNAVWVLLVVAVVCGLAAQGFRLLRHAHGAGERWLPGAVVATGLALLLLLEFHWLLVVRLSVVTRPDSPMTAGLAPDALLEGGRAVLLPAAGLAALLALVDRASGPGSHCRRHRMPPARWRAVMAVAAVALLFLLPVVAGEQLAFLGLATPEYGKVVYFAVLAVVVARYVVWAGLGAPSSLPWYRDRRVAYPAGLFLLVAVTSMVRHDLGPLIPVFAGTLGMTWCALRDEAVRKAAPGDDQRGRAVRAARRTFLADLRIPAAIILIFAVAAWNTDYVRARVEVQNDPWRYVWSAECVVPGDADAGYDLTVPASRPHNAGVCVENQRAIEASKRSQLARAGAAIADGGLWGRGLSDTESKIVPLQESDFVLAAVWSKLGGLVVLELGALLALLAAALGRAVWLRRRAVEGYSTLPPPPTAPACSPPAWPRRSWASSSSCWPRRSTGCPTRASPPR